jgi:hypothetical protein
MGTLMWGAGLEHLALLLTIIGSALGIRKGIKVWRAESIAAIEARAEQQRTIDQIAAEFKPRNGKTLAEVVAKIDASVTDHHVKADKWFQENADAHKEIHRRIDGLFQLEAGRGSTQPRKIAEWHRVKAEREEEDPT